MKVILFILYIVELSAADPLGRYIRDVNEIAVKTSDTKVEKTDPVEQYFSDLLKAKSKKPKNKKDEADDGEEGGTLRGIDKKVDKVKLKNMRIDNLVRMAVETIQEAVPNAEKYFESELNHLMTDMKDYLQNVITKAKETVGAADAENTDQLLDQVKGYVVDKIVDFADSQMGGVDEAAENIKDTIGGIENRIKQEFGSKKT